MHFSVSKECLTPFPQFEGYIAVPLEFSLLFAMHEESASFIYVGHQTTTSVLGPVLWRLSESLSVQSLV